MHIRKMVLADYAAVYELWKDTPGMGLHDVDDSKEGIERFLAHNPDFCFVAEANGHIAGAILGGFDGRRGHIYHAAVELSCRGNGTGKQLLQAVLDAFRQHQVTKATLVVFKDNEIGNAFWTRAGWTIRPDLNYYGFDLETAD